MEFQTSGITLGKGKACEDAIYAVAIAFNLLNNEMTSYLKDFNLTPAKFNVLMIIKHQGGEAGISQIEISKRLIVTPSNMTRLLEKLEREKFIEKTAQSGDKRVKVIKITAKTAKLLDAVWPGYSNELQRLSSFLHEAEQKTAAKILTKWIAGLSGRR